MLEDNQNKIIFSVKVGKSYKNRGWAIPRQSAIDLLPILPYEEECDIIVDGIHAKAHFNILPRIFYNKNEFELSDYLKKLSDEDPNDRVNLELLLNKDTENKVNKSSSGNNLSRLQDNLIDELRRENRALLKKLDDSVKTINKLTNENEDLKRKIKVFSNSSDNGDNELKKEISNLEEKNMDLEIKLAKLLKDREKQNEINLLLKELSLKIDDLL